MATSIRRVGLQIMWNMALEYIKGGHEDAKRPLH